MVDLHLDRLLSAQIVLQLSEEQVVALAHLALQTNSLLRGEAAGLAITMRERCEVGRLAPLAEPLLDEGGAATELLSDFGNRECPRLGARTTRWRKSKE